MKILIASIIILHQALTAQTVVNPAPSDVNAGIGLFRLKFREAAKDSIYTLRVGGTIGIPIAGTTKLMMKFVKTRNDPSRVTVTGRPAEVVRRLTLATYLSDTSRYRNWAWYNAYSSQVDTSEFHYSPYATSVQAYQTLFTPVTFKRDSFTLYCELRSMTGSGTNTTATIRAFKESYPFIPDSVAVIPRQPHTMQKQKPTGM